MSLDPVTGLPVGLDAFQPLVLVDTTLALLRVWQQARPQQVHVDVYEYDANAGLWVMTVRN